MTRFAYIKNLDPMWVAYHYRVRLPDDIDSDAAEDYAIETLLEDGDGVEVVAGPDPKQTIEGMDQVYEFQYVGEEEQQERDQQALAMKTCGCGATKPSECTAAVEGYFTSLSQRSEEELRSLVEGDGCEAAAVLLVKRGQKGRDA